MNSPPISLRVYPNPATDLIILEYVLANPRKVIIGIYNNTGKKIKMLYNNQLDSGTYILQLVPIEQGFSTGIYVIKAFLNGTFFSEEIVIAM